MSGARRAQILVLIGSAFLASCTSDEGVRRPEPTVAPAPGIDLPGSLELVGHEPLFARGMNAGLAVSRGYAYVGSRTDGSAEHEHAGVLVVDVHDPSRPEVMGEIGPPHEGNPGETSRELRVWPSERLLLVLNFGCDEFIHDCRAVFVRPTIRFYDISGRRASAPELVSTYEPSLEPHEFFLWADPQDPDRALLFMSTTDTQRHLLITDVSGARDARFEELATWAAEFPDPGPSDFLHSLSVSPDGRRAYLAYLSAGFLVIDTSDVVNGLADPAVREVTRLEDRPQWPGWGAHSAIRVPGRDVVLTTDEVYGAAEGGGCPWGWARLIDIGDETAPRVLSEFRVHPYNEDAYCAEVDSEQNLDASFSSHNPTATSDLALVSWHSAGLQAISIEDPARPLAAAAFVPEPVSEVTTEDPALSSGPEKVVFWSYPIVYRGLIYVVDVRNGLFVLRYDGPFADEVSAVRFLEGNSNLGDARDL